MRATSQSRRSVRAPGLSLESVRLDLADGAATTVQVARFERERFDVKVVAIEPTDTVLRWCA
ncbi:MAG TPA: hypothetical protein VGV69_07385, partial [Solirubrobacterales bacterium]|nr:hypothetical protein [Solirubrobacterales bacterium]